MVQKKKLLIFIVAYNAAKFIKQVVQRIPTELADLYDVEILVIDDASNDRTFEIASEMISNKNPPMKLKVLVNPINQGYGGNQKIGYWYAIRNKFDFVALLHGDGQYAPEYLPNLLFPLINGDADVVFGSRMIDPKAAINGGMPFYKFIGNRILTKIQNALLKSTLSEFHSGYRVYSVVSLSLIPFDLNTNDFHFDTEIIIQLLIANQRIIEVPIPTYYGDEICHVNGYKYALNVVKTTLKANIQRYGLYYDRKYDCQPKAGIYLPKLSFRSPHSLALKSIKPGSHVLDLGCAGGYLGEALKKQKFCRVVGVDIVPLDNIELDGFILHDLNDGLPDVDMAQFDYVLLLDVIEHLESPEKFVAELRETIRPNIIVLVSSANIAHIITRLSLLFGNFNYGKRGILDLTHRRLFTFNSLKALFQMANYEILHVTGTPIPFPLVISSKNIATTLLNINTFLLYLFKRLFSFQSFLILSPKPSLTYLLNAAEVEAEMRSNNGDVLITREL
ncbi:MAG: glycosyltransferase [Bacteroidales bacterium]|nr:glycosyltransferase [Bacteroidales bacterium]